jgi:4,5-dihydroxyphthalate decarboxylase
MRAEELFWRMIRYHEFDVSEMSLSGYVLQRARGLEDFVAIPVFLSRAFRHACFYINTESGIVEPSDLKGRKIGVPEYQITAAVWARGILSDDYGVTAQDMDWYQGGLENPGRVPFEPVEPEGVRLQFPPPAKTLSGMIASGELDALISPREPSTFQNGAGTVRRLFPEPWTDEKKYFERTGIFPIMHVVVIRRALLDENPWIAQELYKGFLESKRLAMEDLLDPAAVPASLPFLTENINATIDLMGKDFWPYGIEANRVGLETFVRYLVEQGMIKEAIPVEELFAESTRRMRLGI